MTFENKIYEGIHYSRFCASFRKVVHQKRDGWLFKEWLEQLVINGNHIPEDVVMEIMNFYQNGKLELEENARVFIEKNKDRI